MKDHIKILNKAKNIALFSHESPDPDTIGSTVALALMLKQKGKNVSLFCESDIPEQYNFLDEVKLYNSKELDDSFDLLCSVDIAAPDMLGRYKEKFLSFSNTLRIDHHANSQAFAKVNMVEIESACAVVIFDLAKKLKVKVTPEIADALYFAICGDTGLFRNNNTDSKTFSVCSKLLEYGANIRRVYGEFYDKKTVPFVKMTSQVLLNAKINDDMRYVILKACAKDYEKFGLSEENDNLGNLPHTYLNCGYKIAVVLKEKSDAVKCSLRSKVEYDVSEIANVFGGGGHKNAAGCSFDCSLTEAAQQMEKAIKEYLKNKGE